ncbi:AraC family transcriptional regulator [Spirilliplanes yamanashiensis]|uniref:AraC family transcriptional regulator n=1 Tax=Spirilliplanes yamanashiensis TaxID=42233 RepID=UPI001EF2C8C6|nr:AraC family transcriptional regulator [Spirilliplanes yamanashiensis]MDP9815224.1 AraC-like DNA-binding protein [Spirilliplanes yamanashiensis]
MRTNDVDQACDIVGEQFYPNRLDLLDPAQRLDAAFSVVRCGGVTVGDVRFGGDVRMRVGELGAYHVDLPLSGRLTWRQGRSRERLADTGRAGIFAPVGDTVLDRWEADCRLIAVKISRPVLEAELHRMTGKPLRGPLRLAAEMDVTGGPGRSWAWLARMLADEAGNDGSLADHPLVGPRLREGLVRGLLVAAGDRHRDGLTGPGPATAAPKSIRRAMAAVQDEPDHPYTVGRLAEIAGVSVRALQQGFRTHAATTPMGYVRDVRLGRAHRDLCAAAPGTVGVSEVAHRWGFVHLGRFAEQYRARYGVNPSATLRAG